MTPDEVETIATPSPPSTRGISVLRAYTRRPGRLMRRSPETAGTLPPMYFILITISRAEGWSNDVMKPSAFRIFATSSFVRLAGIVTVSWRAPAPLRTRVSMSASGSLGAPPTRGFFGFAGAARFTGAGRGATLPSPTCGSSVVSVGGVVSFVISISPARLRHAGQLAHERALAETDAAQAEFAHIATRTPAHLAAVVALHLVLRRSLGLEDQALLGHEWG